MKLQNCILINFERTHGRMEVWTERCMDKPKAICPFNFSKVRALQLFQSWGHKNEGLDGV